MRSTPRAAGSSGPTIRRSTVNGRATPAVTPSIAGSPRYDGRLYVAALDGWLHALDARTGRRCGRSTRSIGAGAERPYTLTGAPLLAGDLVVIGSGGRGFRGRPRLCHRLRSARAAAALALLHRAAQSRGGSAGSAASRGGHQDLGSQTSLGEPAAAARRGTAWRMTRRCGSCTSAPATRLPITCTWAAATAAMSSMPPRSSRSMPTTARSRGTTRPRPATGGISTAREKIVLADLELDGKRRER